MNNDPKYHPVKTVEQKPLITTLLTVWLSYYPFPKSYK